MKELEKYGFAPIEGNQYVRGNYRVLVCKTVVVVNTKGFTINVEPRIFWNMLERNQLEDYISKREAIKVEKQQDDEETETVESA